MVIAPLPDEQWELIEPEDAPLGGQGQRDGMCETPIDHPRSRRRGARSGAATSLLFGPGPAF